MPRGIPGFRVSILESSGGLKDKSSPREALRLSFNVLGLLEYEIVKGFSPDSETLGPRLVHSCGLALREAPGQPSRPRILSFAVSSIDVVVC